MSGGVGGRGLVIPSYPIDELPDTFFVIELEQQLLILLVASDDAQHSVGVGALLLLQDERTVCRAQ